MVEGGKLRKGFRLRAVGGSQPGEGYFEQADRVRLQHRLQLLLVSREVGSACMHDDN